MSSPTPSNAQPTSLPVIVLDRLPLTEVWSKADPTERAQFAFPIAGTTGAQALSLCYAELRPGGGIPWHYDSTEDEVLLVLAGAVHVAVQSATGDEEVVLQGGGALLIPARKPHTVRNYGTVTAKTVHIFGSPNVAVTFADPLMPMGMTVLGGYGAQ